MSDTVAVKWQWGISVVALLALVGTAVGHRFAIVVEDVSFALVLLVEVLLLATSWWRLARTWREEAARWRVWLGLAGCVMFSLTFVIPAIPMFFFFMRWQPQNVDFRALWLGFSIAVLVAGVLAARRVRFPLIVGGMVMSIVMLMIPVAVL